MEEIWSFKRKTGKESGNDLFVGFGSVLPFGASLGIMYPNSKAVHWTTVFASIWMSCAEFPIHFTLTELIHILFAYTSVLCDELHMSVFCGVHIWTLVNVIQLSIFWELTAQWLFEVHMSSKRQRFLFTVCKCGNITRRIWISTVVWMGLLKKRFDWLLRKVDI